MKGRYDRNNHANQMNPNNDAYWQSRGYNERPDDWEDQVDKEEQEQVQERRNDARGAGGNQTGRASGVSGFIRTPSSVKLL